MKLITDYEVEGCWTGLKSKSKCRACGEVLQTTPKTKHYNSQYWELKRHNDERLVNCPYGCPVELADKKMKEYLAIRYYCTSKSESWNYQLNYTIINHAWIDRKGKVYPLSARGHIAFAIDRGFTEYYLESKGWLKLSNVDFYWEKTLSKKQIDFVFDYLVDNERENESKEFMDISKNSSGCL